MRRSLPALFAASLAVTLAACASQPAAGAGSQATSRPALERDHPTLVVLVRHAEKVDASADPPLSAAGEARAAALAEALRDAGVSGIVTTQFRRTQETARPLATRLGLTPRVVAASGGDHAAAVATAVRETGGVVLVVGHSNTVPAIVGALGAPRPADLCDGNYDTMFVVELPAGEGTPRLVRTRYGVPDTDATAGCPAMRGP